MAEINLSPGEREQLREKLCTYCERNFDLELEQFDAEFFVDFIAEQLGPMFYNAGIDAAIATHLAWGDRIQEEMDLKKVY